MNAPEVAPLLPSVPVLRELCRAMAAVEFLVAPDNSYRTHSFDRGWSEPWDLAGMDNGGGDNYSIVLSAEAALIRCFDHESPMSPYVAVDEGLWPGLTDGLPPVFASLLKHPDFSPEGVFEATALLWREEGDGAWRTATVEFPPEDRGDDGAAWLLGRLTAADPASAFTEHLSVQYGTAVDPAAVAHVFDGGALTTEVAAALNPVVADPSALAIRASVECG
ncbi:hypothetical protein [Nocardiopsis ansamitocini]|uniref:Uncharacterized protein n=1 Tax=Nocardiopsis ansamitocini TaxID=1670832 RepID=A0A9W6UJI9_9ACTN|nr:hypothetical protein [Nocardiopsis ansamitocini]GLU48558.1 hypothetical protein Nans01_29090 [Nocardiopsis ansamitocini]